MPSTENLEQIPRRVLNIFYILDTSGSMDGTAIATLNRAMGETVEILKKQAKANADALIKIAVLDFNTNCKWLNPAGPEEMDDFIWNKLKAGGLTSVGEALTELDSKLSRSSFLQSMTGAYLPIIIFMSDGFASDNYEKALTEIRKNRWFTRATKIGFAIGDNCDKKMISEVVGNSEAVIHTDDFELFGKLLKFASVTASALQSTSRTADDVVTGADIVKQVVNQSDIDINDVVDKDVDYNPEPPADPAINASTDDWGDADWT